jgi:hypothetical protein
LQYADPTKTEVAGVEKDLTELRDTDPETRIKV